MYAALNTHSKYTDNHMHFTLNFEADVLALLVGHKRVCAYHHEHHINVHAHIAPWGWLPEYVFPMMIGGKLLTDTKTEREEN